MVPRAILFASGWRVLTKGFLGLHEVTKGKSITDVVDEGVAIFVTPFGHMEQHGCLSKIVKKTVTYFLLGEVKGNDGHRLRYAPKRHHDIAG